MDCNGEKQIEPTETSQWMRETEASEEATVQKEDKGGSYLPQDRSYEECKKICDAQVKEHFKQKEPEKKVK